MELREFGNTGMRVSVIGFGAWAIGGPAMAGQVALGWGESNDEISIRALRRAFDLGINFFDTADFYGLGHSEELIGQEFGNRGDVVIATKVGHQLLDDGLIRMDFSRAHILRACERSLRRLRRDTIDFYQLHSVKLHHLQEGACLDTMEELRAAGKIRAWGASLNTFHPEIEGDYLLGRKLGNGFQVVLNAINQRAIPLLSRAAAQGYGIIARMPLQFGLLTGKFSSETTFPQDDHRSFRLKPVVLQHALDALGEFWTLTDKYGISRTSLSLSLAASFAEVSTVIPGIRTPEQAESNTANIVTLDPQDMELVRQLYRHRLNAVVDLMQQNG